MLRIQYCAEFNFQYLLSKNVSSPMHHFLEKNGKPGEHPLFEGKPPLNPQTKDGSTSEIKLYGIENDRRKFHAFITICKCFYPIE